MKAVLTSNTKTKRNLLWSLTIPLCLLIIGFAMASHYINKQELLNQQRIEIAVSQRLQHISEGVKEKVTLYQYGLRATRGAVMAVTPQNFSYQEMQNYTSSRNYDEEFPGARGFGLIRVVQPEETDAFLQRIAQERPGYPFSIQQLQPHQDSLFIIEYIEPEQRNSQAVGLDIGSESMRRNAALDAALNNDTRLTAPITLVQADQRTKQGFLILMPVYKQIPVPNEPMQRLAQLHGWSYASLLIDEILSAINGLEEDVMLHITDVTDQKPVIFFQRGQADDEYQHYQQQMNISLFGREWQLMLMPKSYFISDLQLPSSKRLFLEIMGLTLLLTLSVFLLQLLVMRRSQLARKTVELAINAKASLQEANIDLEKQIAIRTAEISQVSAFQRCILKSAGYSIIATDVNGTITAFNPAAEQLLGYTADEMIGKNTPAVFHLSSEVAARAAELSAEQGKTIEPGFDVFVFRARQGITDSKRWTYVNKAGQHIQVKLNVSPLTNELEQLSGFLGIAFDLSEQIQHEAELAKTKEMAESANQAKSDFLANMSHEIRTPMNAILGLLQLVAKTSLDHRQAEFIDKTQSAARSLLALLNDILDFSKVEAGKLELDPHLFNLSSVLQDIGIILSAGVQNKDVEVLYHIAPNVPRELIGDSLRIKQILLNLAGNAIKFTEHGEVIIAVKAEHLSGERLKLHFNVRDTGIGMTPEQQKSIFSGFHQAESSISRRFGGTGLGLSISKRLIELMNGSISLQSELGQGSDFQFELTLLQANSAKINFGESISLLPTDIKVLIVDDNATARLIMYEMILSFGWSADLAEDAEQASVLLDQAAEKKTTYTLLFVDWRMPGMDGLEFAKKIRNGQHSSTAPLVIMVTAYGKEVIMSHSQSYQQWLDGFIVKPVTHDMVLRTVQAVLNIETPQLPVPVKVGHTLLLKNYTLLLVEDNLTNQLVATELLRDKGAVVDVATSGENALDMIFKQPKRYDLVLMDIQMPEMDGYQTTVRIREQIQFASLPIIAMTANALITDKVACLAAGMQDHIAKPFDLDEVVEKILRYSSKSNHNDVKSKQESVYDEAISTFCAEHDIQLKKSLARLGQSKLLYLKILHQFSRDLRESVQKLQHSALSRKQEKILFHSLKGAAATVGFIRLARLAAKLENDVNNDDQDNKERSQSFLSFAQIEQDTVFQLLQMLDIKPINQVNSLELTSDDLRYKLKLLMSHLLSSDMASIALFQELLPSLKHNDAELAEHLNSAISGLEFESAIEILKKILPENAE